MTIEIAILFGIIGLVIISFVTEWISADLTAFMSLVIIIVFGFVTPEEGISGFSNIATITILALMILSAGLEQTGFIGILTIFFKKIFVRGEKRTTTFLMSTVGVFSGFINTTAVVVVFIQIVRNLSRSININQSKLLMPLSFAGILGGSCSLIGTSTNILVSDISNRAGIGAFGIFEFSWIGAILLLTGILYMVLIGRFLIPERGKEGDVIEKYSLSSYMARLRLNENAPWIGKRYGEIEAFKNTGLHVLSIRKNNRSQYTLIRSENIFELGDQIIVRGPFEKISEVLLLDGVDYASAHALEMEYLDAKKTKIVEVLVRPTSRAVGRRVGKFPINEEHSVIPIGINKGRKYFKSNVSNMKIEAGDVILLHTTANKLKALTQSKDFVVLQDHDDTNQNPFKAYLSAAIMVSVILLAAFGVVPILVSTLIGCAAMFLTGCIELQDAYEKIDWKIIFLLACIIPVGIAMKNTGADQWIAVRYTDFLMYKSPVVIIASLFVITSGLSAIISNNATAILVAPIAITISSTLGLDPKPLLFTVMFAANSSFITPIGYQTNAMIYTIGGYKFKDFIIVGGGLTLIIGILVTFIISRAYF